MSITWEGRIVNSSGQKMITVPKAIMRQVEMEGYDREELIVVITAKRNIVTVGGTNIHDSRKWANRKQGKKKENDNKNI